MKVAKAWFGSRPRNKEPHILQKVWEYLDPGWGWSAVFHGGGIFPTQLPASRTDLLSSSLAQGPWQIIWSELTCGWYQKECAMLGRASVTQTVRRKHSKTSCARRDKVSDKPITDQSKPKLWEQRAAKGLSGFAWNVQTCWKLTRSPSPEAQSGQCITRHPFIPHAKKLKQPQKPFREAVKWHLIKNTLAALLLRWKVSHVKSFFSFSCSFR